MTVREKPQRGVVGVPFMKTTNGFDFTRVSIASWTTDLVLLGLLALMGDVERDSFRT